MTARLAFLVWFLVGAAMFAAVAFSPSARADTAGGCTHRSVAHQVEHGGLKADSLWHQEHGELPTCDPEPEEANRSSDRKSDDGKDRDKKSRYCRKHWYC